MATNIVDKYRVQVSTEISIHEAITAVMMFAEKYPAERLTRHMAEQLRSAARMIDETLEERRIEVDRKANNNRPTLESLTTENRELYSLKPDTWESTVEAPTRPRYGQRPTS